MHAAAIRIFNPFAKGFISEFRAPDEVRAERNPKARECFEQMVTGHPGCESETGAHMLMAMYPDQF